MLRRDLIKLGIAGFCLPAASVLSACSENQNSRFFSALRKGGKDHIAGFNHLGELEFLTEIPERGHGGAYSSLMKHLAWPARSPGNNLYIIDNAGELIQTVAAEQGHHFYGHAQFSVDGRYLISTENHFSDGQGRIVIRDAQNSYQVVNAFYSGGIGPHELRLMSDGNHLIIANGGILTHPEKSGKLNLSAMKPNLSIMNIHTGQIIQQLELADHKLSIRHLALNNQDQLVLLTQYQGRSEQALPLLYSWQPGEQSLTALANPVDPERMVNQN